MLDGDRHCKREHVANESEFCYECGCGIQELGFNDNRVSWWE